MKILTWKYIFYFLIGILFLKIGTLLSEYYFWIRLSCWVRRIDVHLNERFNRFKNKLCIYARFEIDWVIKLDGLMYTLTRDLKDLRTNCVYMHATQLEMQIFSKKKKNPRNATIVLPKIPSLSLLNHLPELKLIFCSFKSTSTVQINFMTGTWRMIIIRKISIIIDIRFSRFETSQVRRPQTTNIELSWRNKTKKENST